MFLKKKIFYSSGHWKKSISSWKKSVYHERANVYKIKKRVSNLFYRFWIVVLFFSGDQKRIFCLNHLLCTCFILNYDFACFYFNEAKSVEAHAKSNSVERLQSNIIELLRFHPVPPPLTTTTTVYHLFVVAVSRLSYISVWEDNIVLYICTKNINWTRLTSQLKKKF